GINAGAGLDLVGQLLSMTNTLGYDHDEVLLAGLLGLVHAGDDVVVQIVGTLGNQDSQSAGGDAHVQGNVASVTSHNLNHTAAVMALGSVAQLIDHLHSGVHGGVVADGVLAAGDVVVDGAGN